MSRFSPEQVQITVIDPKSKLIGRIDGDHVQKYCYEVGDIATTLEELASTLTARLPRAGLSQQELIEQKRRGFDGPRQVASQRREHAPSWGAI